MPAALEVDDAIVLILGAPGPDSMRANYINGITRLEKLLFLLENETELAQYLAGDSGFKAYNFGPFSEEVYHMIPILAAARLITNSVALSDTSDDTWEYRSLIDDVDWDEDPNKTREFELTPLGQKYYSSLLDDLPDGTEEELAQFKARFAALPLRQLIRYVYLQYPQFTVNSVIREAVLGR